MLSSRMNQSLKIGKRGEISSATDMMNPSKRVRTEKKTFTEQLWIMGKVIGTIEGTFKINNLPVL